MTRREIVIEVPESVLAAENNGAAGLDSELRVLAALKLYELGRLSSSSAAELAGMPLVEFLLALGRYRVFPFESELDDLENTDA